MESLLILQFRAIYLLCWLYNQFKRLLIYFDFDYTLDYNNMNCLTEMFNILKLMFGFATCEERITLIDRNINRERSVIIECTLLDNTLNDVDHSALVSVLDSLN